MRTISLEQLLIDPKYKQLSLFDLRKVINGELLFSGFEQLSGEYSDDKAKILYSKWHPTTITLSSEITGEEMQDILKITCLEGQMLRQLIMTQPIKDVHDLYHERMCLELE
jgi:hypothetical protein